MKACHIRGFIEEIGHEADELLEGACEENPEECKEETAAKVNRIGLLAATGTIEQARKKTDDECDEE